MGWRERDYSREIWAESATGGRTFRWPPRGAAVLIGLHVAAFVLLSVIASEGGEHIANLLPLSESTAHPLAIFLHPLAAREVFSLILTILVIWLLAAPIERRDGAGRMVSLYVAGNLLAGLVFFAMARFWPILAGMELDYPAGAFAAWCIAAYRGMASEMVPIFGQLRRVSRVVGICLAVVIGLMLAFHGLGAIGWLGALLAGACAEPLLQRLILLLKPGERPPRRSRVSPSIPRARSSKQPEEPDIDSILAKISVQGIDSLTQEERNRLEAARQAKLRKS